MKKRRKVLFSALSALLLAGGVSSCSSVGGYWGLHGSTEMVSDGHGGYYPKHKKPKPPKKHKHKHKKHKHDNRRDWDDWDD